MSILFWIGIPIVSLLAEVETPKTITLEEAYDRVLLTDQSIQVAFQEIQKAKLLPWSALTQVAPSFTGNASYNNNPGSSTTTRSGNNRQESNQAQIILQQPLLDLTVFANYHVGKLSASSARLQRSFTARETLFGVAQVYYDVLKQQRLTELNQESLNLAIRQLDLSQNRFELGDATRTDVLRAKLSVETFRQTLLESQNSLKIAQNLFGNILNLDASQRNFQLVAPDFMPFEDDSLEAMLGRALQQREDYEISSLAIEQENGKKDAILAEYAPKVVGQVKNTWIDSSPTTSSSSQNNSSSTWDAAITLQMPFFEGGLREVSLRTAEHQIHIAQLNREKLGKTIQEDVHNAWLQVRLLRDTLKTLVISVEAADQAYQDIQAQYENGMLTSLDSLIALRDLNTAKTDFAIKTFDYEVALRNFQRVTGDFQIKKLAKVSQ